MEREHERGKEETHENGHSRYTGRVEPRLKGEVEQPDGSRHSQGLQHSET